MRSPLFFPYGPLVRQEIVRRLMIFGCWTGVILILIAAGMMYPDEKEGIDCIGLLLCICIIIVPLSAHEVYRRPYLFTVKYLGEQSVDRCALREVVPTLLSTFWYASGLSQLGVLLGIFIATPCAIQVLPLATFLPSALVIYGFMFWHYTRCLQVLPAQVVTITDTEIIVPTFGFMAVYMQRVAFTDIYSIENISSYRCDGPLFGIALSYKNERGYICVFSRALLPSLDLAVLLQQLELLFPNIEENDRRIKKTKVYHY